MPHDVELHPLVRLENLYDLSQGGIAHGVRHALEEGVVDSGVLHALLGRGVRVQGAVVHVNNFHVALARLGTLALAFGLDAFHHHVVDVVVGMRLLGLLVVAG